MLKSPQTRRLLALAATFAVLAGACTSAATTAPSAAAPGSVAPTTAATAAPPATTIPTVDITEHAYQPTPATKTGGTVVVAEWEFIDNFLCNYYSSSLASCEAFYPAFNGLWRVANDFKWYPDLATSVPTPQNGGVVVNGDKMDLKFDIKSGAKWSDGQPITCDDVIATWKWIMDKDQSGLVGGTVGWEDIASIDGAGTNSCVIHFNKVYEGYLGLIDPLLPAHYITTIPVKDAPTKLYPLSNITSGVFSGPYIPTEIKTNAQITYAPNPNAEAVVGHKPYLDKLIFKYYSDADAMVAGFRAGESDIAMDLDQSYIPKTQDLGSQVTALDALTYELNQLNNASLAKKFGEADVPTIKQAIRLAYDKSAITTRVQGNTVQPSNTPFSPMLYYYKDEPAVTQDLAQANQLLEQAGWVKGSDGIRAKNGVKLDITACTTKRQSRIDTLTLVGSWLKQIGINMTLKPVPANPDFFGGWDQVSADTPCNLQRGNYDLAEFAWSYSPDPIVSYNVYNSVGIPDNPPHSGQNTTRTNDPGIDKAYNTVKTSVDPVVIKQAMGDFQDLYYKDVTEIPLFNWKELWLSDGKVGNYVPNPTQFSVMWNTGDWYLK